MRTYFDSVRKCRHSSSSCRFRRVPLAAPPRQLARMHRPPVRRRMNGMYLNALMQVNFDGYWKTNICHRTKMPLRAEVGLGPGDFVFDGDPAPLPRIKGTDPHQIFGPCLLWPNGWMNQDVTWYGGKPRPRRSCVICGRSPPP